MKRRARGRALALTIFCCALLSLLFLYARASSTAIEPEPQQKRRPPKQQQPSRRRPATGQAQAGNRDTAARNYARFKHEDHRQPVAKLNCADCHTIRSPAAPDLVSAATKPEVDGYPYHDSCVRCHRQQFFKGASPAICTVCHTRATPRLTARDMHSFPKQNESAIAREFPGYFPHSLHQSVIARKGNAPPAGNTAERREFVRASFKTLDEPPAKASDNCATCHLTDERAPVAMTAGAAEATFKPEAKGTFKTVPAGHAACFNCHWQSQQPLKDDCAGCHLSQSEYTKKKRAASTEAALPGMLSPKAIEWFKDWPSAWPKRLSLKFRHETANHDIGCTTCHINLVQMETLNIPKADVPIATCAICHVRNNSPVLRKEGETVTFFLEMTAEASDKENKTNTCTGCHTAQIGRERPPCSHYLVLGQPCQQ